jgi:hypothetical protein
MSEGIPSQGELSRELFSALRAVGLSKSRWYPLIEQHKEKVISLLSRNLNIGFTVEEFSQACGATEADGLKTRKSLNRILRNEVLLPLKEKGFLKVDKKCRRWLICAYHSEGFDAAALNRNLPDEAFYKKELIIDGFHVTKILHHQLEQPDFSGMSILCLALDTCVKEHKTDDIYKITCEMLRYFPEDSRTYYFALLVALERGHRVAVAIAMRYLLIKENRLADVNDWFDFGFDFLKAGYHRASLKAFMYCLYNLKTTIKIEGQGRLSRDALFQLIKKLFQNAKADSVEKELEVFYSTISYDKKAKFPIRKAKRASKMATEDKE